MENGIKSNVRPQVNGLEYATAHPRKDLKMPLPPVPGSNPPALPPRRNVPPPPPPASPSPPPPPVAEDYEEPTIPPREPHNIIITVQEEYYDEFDVEDENSKTAPTVDTDEDYDEFDIIAPDEGPPVYELDNSPAPSPPPLPAQQRRGPLPKPPPQEEVYDVAGDDEEEDASAGSYHSTGVASSGSDDQPPPVPPLNNRRPKPNPPTRVPEKKFTPPSVPGGGVIDIRAISEGRNRLRKVDKPLKPAEEPKEKIKPLVVLKPEKVTTNSPKPTPPSKPGPPSSFLKKNIFKTFMSSINKDKDLPPIPPLPPVKNNTSPHNSNISKSEDTTHSDGVNDDHVTSSTEPEVNTSEEDDSQEIYDECVSVSDPLAKFPWYHMNVDRDTANARIKKINKDGTFLIRNSGRSKTTNTSHPYTLCVLYENRIRNLKIRQRSDKKFALGEYKDNEMTFDSIEKLVENHQKNDVLLIGKQPGNVKLLHVASNH